jgi:hypothetical protein
MADNFGALLSLQAAHRDFLLKCLREVEGPVPCARRFETRTESDKHAEMDTESRP